MRRLLIWDGEGAVGQYRGGDSRLTVDCQARRPQAGPSIARTSSAAHTALGELFGPAASVPTARRTLSEIAAGGTKTGGRTAAVNSARRTAWARVAAGRGALPGIRIAGKVLSR